RNAALRLSFAEGELVVSAETPDLGDAREALPAPYSGELLEIGFNPEFVRDGLESIESDEVVFKLISPLRPGLLEPPADDDFSYLVMPIRLNVEVMREGPGDSGLRAGATRDGSEEPPG